jgi:hypothetical protein
MILEQYVFFFLVFTISAYFLYTRIRYPFWSHMPVSHTYDLIQFSDGVIQSNPKRNKFTNPALVKTASFFELGDDQQKAATQLFNCFYIPSDVIFSTLSPEILKTRMTGHLGTPFVSADPSFAIGCAVSYPVNIIHGTGQTVANYLAYLATDRDQNISRALISTHDFNARSINPNVSSTLYKKHVGKCAGAQPLVEFKTSVFYINVEGSNLGLNTANTALGSAATQAHIIQIYKPNWNLLQDYLSCISSGTQSCISSGTQSSVSGTKSMTALFDFVAIVDIGALSARVDANQLFVYAYRIGTQIVALYFIEDMNTLYENVADYGGKTLSLVASVNNILEPDGIAVFYNGFVEAVQKISKQNRDYKMMVIDDVGHNAQIVERTKLVKPAIFETEGGYYWINHRVGSHIVGERCLILI